MSTQEYEREEGNVAFAWVFAGGLIGLLIVLGLIIWNVGKWLL